MIYRPIIFNKDPPRSMLKTLSTIIKASHHQARTQSMEPVQLLNVKQEILAQIDTKLLEINNDEPIEIGILENIISNYYNGVINCLLPSFLDILKVLSPLGKTLKNQSKMLPDRLGVIPF